MTLGQKRRLHSWLVPDLLNEIKRLGFLYELGAGFVDPGVTDSPHRADGSHPKGLALDVLLFRCPHTPAHLLWACPDPRYLQDTPSYQAVGTWWKAQHALCRWGGDWGDGNHFSLEDGGVA